MIIDINWPYFNVKFNERQQSAFERLSYFLFCNEYELPGGIFRFKNQAGIETEPIISCDEVIGFQAKFYQESVSPKKQDLIDSLNKAKSKNTSLSQVLVYVNREFGESSKAGKKKGVYQNAIESYAQTLGIKIRWRVFSHFEYQLSLPQNHYLAEYFFGNSPGIVEKLSALDSHTSSLLEFIKTGIRFKNQFIHITRAFPDQQEILSKSNVTIVSGDGGCGKTAYIKERLKDESSAYYVFKAVEFNVNHVNEVFGNSNAITLAQFIDAHKEENGKTVVIDSAEKVSELVNEDPFREFLTALLTNNWKVVFTTRSSFLEALEYLLMRIYEVPFAHFRIPNLEEDELVSLSEKYQFLLPTDKRVRRLLCNLFYLEEYLAGETGNTGSPDLATFRENLWRRKIAKSDRTVGNLHIEREKCFLKLARKRAEDGSLFIQGDDCSDAAITALCNDEIIAHDAKSGGYFIAHDIYEEWALERLIGSEFTQRVSNESFFTSIGTSLPVRRAFRNWLAEGLESQSSILYQFTEWVLNDQVVQGFWQDEVLISILLTDYATNFFDDFKEALIANDKEKLKKVIFLLRIACKEPDVLIYNRYANSGGPAMDPAVFFTKPKGPGWGALYAFLYSNLKEFSAADLGFIVPVLKEWDIKFGAEMKNVASFAYYFYDLIEQDDELYFPNEIEKDLIGILLSGAKEIKDKLIKFFDLALTVTNGRRNHPYDSFLDAALTDHNQFIGISAALPDQILLLANHLWFKPVAQEHEFDFGGMGVEKYYSIRERWHTSFTPISAYQTPLYWMLYFHMQKSVDFIIEFTNKTVAAYAASGELETVSEMSFQLPNGDTVTQFGSGSIWCIFRGYSSPTTPSLLECLHMALEKRLLEIAKEWKPKTVASWLLHILRRSRSVSLTAVVTSVFLAHPNKFFEIGLSLFTGLGFYNLDNYRLQMESSAKRHYGMGYMGEPGDRTLIEERLKTCEDKHRSDCLESLIRHLQFFKSSGDTSEQFEARKNNILQVIDQLYEKAVLIIDDDEKINAGMLIARIDSRKMNPVQWQQGEHTIIEFRPQLTPELEQAQQEAITFRQDFLRYQELKQWAEFHFDEHIGRLWPKYTDKPELVLTEVRELVEALSTGDESFYLRNHAIPAYACYALLKLHSDMLSKDDLEFCKEIIVGTASSMLRENYNYQIGDGVEVAVNALPFLYLYYKEEVDDLILILLLCAFDDYPIGSNRCGDYVIDSIHRHLYRISPETAKAVFISYLYFKPKFNEFAGRSAKYHARTFGHRRSQAQLVQAFFNKNKKAFAKLSKTCDDLYRSIDWSKLKLADWDTGMKFIPPDTHELLYTNFVDRAAQAVLPELVMSRHFRNRDERWDYALPHRFFQKYSRFLIHRNTENIAQFIAPVLSSFTISDEIADLFGEIIDAADHHPNPDVFWIIWNSLYDAMVAAGQVVSGRDFNKMLHNFLLAWRWWSSSLKEWHTLRSVDRSFLKKASVDFGGHTGALYSVAKVLNDIGSQFLKEGIGWLSKMISSNAALAKDNLEINTIYYLELVCRRYVYEYRTELRQHRLNATDVLVILNFLIRKASVSAYLLREDII